MKQSTLLILAIATLTACSKEEPTPPPQAAPPPPATVSATPTAPSAVTPPAATPPPATTAQAPSAPDIDAGAEKRMPNGNLAQDTLEYLNGLVAHLNEGRGTYSTDATPTFKNEQEKQAYDAALKKMKEPITDLEELVKARLIKKIPAAPAGKKFVINPTTHKVELANQ